MPYKDPAAAKEKYRAYREANREELREQHRKWRLANPEKLRASRRRNATARGRGVRKWVAEHPERVREMGREQKARRRGAVDRVAVVEYERVLRADPCGKCGRTSEHVDHIVPLAGGGAADWDNLSALCGPCNQRKAAKPLLAFLLGL